MGNKIDWSMVFVIFALVWMLYVGWALYIVITRPLWPTVPMTYVCESDGKNCDWKWPTQVLGK